MGVVITSALGFWMRWENVCRDRTMGVGLKAGDVPTSEMRVEQSDRRWRRMGGVS